MQVFKSDIKDKATFTVDGERLTLKECLNEEKHIYLFERYNKDGRLYAYELVKGVKVKNPDGSIVYKYPSPEQFGKYAYFIAKNQAYGERGISYLYDVLSQRGEKR